MKHKIVLLKGGKKIFQMNIKPSKKSKLGDSDIMLDAGKGMYFDHVVLGNYFKQFLALKVSLIINTNNT